MTKNHLRMPYRDGDPVTVTIRGEVGDVGDHSIDIYVPGIENAIRVPLVDDADRDLADVAVVHTPTVRPGDVWMVRLDGQLLFAGVDSEDETAVRLVTHGCRSMSPAEAAHWFGPLDLVVSSEPGDRAAMFHLPPPYIVVEQRLVDPVLDEHLLGDRPPAPPRGPDPAEPVWVGYLNGDGQLVPAPPMADVAAGAPMPPPATGRAPLPPAADGDALDVPPAAGTGDVVYEFADGPR